MKQYVLGMVLMSLIVSANETLSYEGYGIVGYTSQEDAFGEVSLEPSYHPNPNIDITAVIGIEHPAEDGSGTEIELEGFFGTYRMNTQWDLTVGKIHMPIGLYNLYHEPIYFPTIAPSMTESHIIPTEWHESAVMLHYTQGPWSVMIGAMSPMESTKVVTSSWIRDGKEHHLNDHLDHPGYFARIDHGTIDSCLIGGSIVSTPLLHSEAQAYLSEVHLLGHYQRLHLLMIGAYGHVSHTHSIMTPTASTTRGFNTMIGYDLISSERGRLMGFIQHDSTHTTLDHEDTLSTGLNYFITPTVVLKGHYSTSTLTDESVSIALGWTFPT